MDLSVIIVNYNTAQMLCDCIASVRRHLRGVDYEVIVVDNGSTDGSRSICLSKDPAVRWIDAGTNIGYGRANNLGISVSHGEYLWLLNSDTLLLDDPVTRMLSWCRTHPEAGCVGPCLVDAQGCPTESAGYFIGPLERLRVIRGRLCGRILKYIHRQRDTIACFAQEVDYVTGAAMMIRRDTFLEAGGFDADYHMYCEDMDLQRRLADCGYRNFVLRVGGVVHMGGRSYGLTPTARRQRISAWMVSRRIYARKHLSPTARIMTRISEILLLGPLKFKL